jgi:hypothetical protein
MEIFEMSHLMLVVVVAVSAVIFYKAEARQYYIRNMSDDSFSVNVSADDQRVVITPLITIA